MAGAAGLFKFITPRLRLQPIDVKAAAMWGVAAASTGIWIVQPFDWFTKTFLEKPEPEKLLTLEANAFQHLH